MVVCEVGMAHVCVSPNEVGIFSVSVSFREGGVASVLVSLSWWIYKM